eukprot:1818877-Pyramimonas_sp.AAC.1
MSEGAPGRARAGRMGRRSRGGSRGGPLQPRTRRGTARLTHSVFYSPEAEARQEAPHRSEGVQREAQGCLGHPPGGGAAS